MQVQIRMAESGYSYHYTGLTTVHALMHQIRKDFKIQLQDQKIIMKSGQLLKSTMAFDSIQQSMKKTIPTNNSTAFNPSLKSQIKQIQCLYIYNQKQLLKPNQQKPFDNEHHLKLHREKFKEMSLLAENSYQLKQFNDKISQKNIIPMIESISKKLKIPFENILYRYTRFHDNLNQRKYYKMQIASLLDLIQNQDKARKLLIKNVQWTHDKRTKKRLLHLKQKITKQTQKQHQMSMKQNSSLFSSHKDSYCSDTLKQLTRIFEGIQAKNTLFFQRLKNCKRQVTKSKFLPQQKITFQIDKKVTSNQKEYEQNIKQVKLHFEMLCEQIIKVNSMLTKNKESKQAMKQLLAINEKILTFQKVTEEYVKEFTQMYLELTKIHVKGESQNIKIVFGIYVELIKAYEDLQSDVRKFQKQLAQYKQQKSHQQVKVSQFSENRNNNIPLKKPIKSPKKQQSQKRPQKLQQSLVSKQLQNSNMLKINSPIKNKICKNSLKSFTQQITFKNFQLAVKDNKQLLRRLEFSRRVEELVKYCGELCDREQDMRKGVKRQKDFEENRVDLLSVLNVPTIDIDYNNSSTVALTQMYKKWLKDNSMSYQVEISWQTEIVDLLHYVSKTLNTYISINTDITQREKSMQKIISSMSQAFYKMMKAKLQKQLQQMRKSISKSAKHQDKQLIESLVRSNQDLHWQVAKLQLQVKRLSLQNKSSLQSLQESITPQTYNLLSDKYHQLISNSRLLEEENQTLKGQVKSLEAQLLAYPQEVKQTTQKLIESYEESNAVNLAELQKLNSELRNQKELTTKFNKEIKDLKSQLQVGKKNLLKQLESIENLFDKITEISQEKNFYQKQFAELKNLLADKQVAIIKLQKQLEAMKKHLDTTHNKAENNSHKNKQPDQRNNHQTEHQCQYSQEVTSLRQKNQELQVEIQNLNRELKEILFKETIDQEIQTQAQDQSHSQSQEELRIKKGKQNIFIPSSLQQQNKQTSKIIPQQKLPTNHHPLITQLATKQSPLNNFHISNNQLPFNTQNQAVSHYYVSSMGQQQWMTSFFNKFTHLVIALGKTIEQGMSHIFLPFSSDIYIGVTVSDQGRQFTNYQDFLSHESSRLAERFPTQPVYILNLKDFNLKTNQMLRECSLVLVVKIQKKGEVSMGNKVMVSGKIEFSLGFQDDDMVIKNYSHFLDE